MENNYTKLTQNGYTDIRHIISEAVSAGMTDEEIFAFIHRACANRICPVDPERERKIAEGTPAFSNDQLFVVYPMYLNAIRDELAKPDLPARERILISHLYLSAAAAKQYLADHTDVSLTDLMTDGNTELLRAADLYDPKAGYSFADYAAWFIHLGICNGLRTTKDGPYLLFGDPEPRSKLPDYVLKAQHRLREEFGREPTEEEIRSVLGLSKAQLQEFLAE